MDCPKLRTALEALARKHDFDLYAGDGGRIELELSSYLPFRIDRITPRRITFGYYKDIGGENVDDPEICIEIQADGRWVPAYYSRWPFGRLLATAAEVEEYADPIRKRYVESDHAWARVSQMTRDGESITR